MEKLARFLNGILKVVITLFLTAMIVLVFMNVVLRYAFDSGLTQSEELSRFIFVWIVFLGAMVAHQEKGHLGVDLLIGAVPAKIQKIMYTLVQIIVIGVLVVVIDGGMKMVMISSNSYSPATGIPMAVLYYAGLLASVSMIILSVMQTIQYVVYNKNAPVWAKEHVKGGN